MKATFQREEEGKLQLTLTTPVSGYENLDLAIEYRLPIDDRTGHFDGRLNTPVNTVFHLTGTGTTKDLSGSFATPYEPFRYTVWAQYLYGNWSDLLSPSLTCFQCNLCLGLRSRGSEMNIVNLLLFISQSGKLVMISSQSTYGIFMLQKL